MQKYIVRGALAALVALALFSVAPTTAQAAVSWNTFGADCHNVVMVGNATTTTNINNPDNCWGSNGGLNSVTASAGDHVDVRVYYNNTGTTDATNTIVHIDNPNTVASTTFNFNGYVASGTAARYSSTPVTMNLTSSQHLTFNSAIWYKDDSMNTGVTLPNGADIMSPGGLNLGTIATIANCPASDRYFCHSGSVEVSFIVSSIVVQPTCTINSFSTTTGAASVAYGNAATLTWNTSGCDYVQISGGAINTTANASGTLPLGAQYQTTTFTLTGHQNNGGVSTPRTFTISVSPQQVACAINSFAPDQSSVAQYGSTMLRWSTSSGCTSVALSGGNFNNTTVSGGSISTGAINASTTYTLTASGTNTTTATTTVAVNTVTPSCVISSFNASPSSITSGSSSMLTWTTSGCTTVTLAGGTYAGSTFGTSGNVTTGTLTNSTTYTLTASGTNTTTATTTVAVNANTTCVVSGLSASSPTVASGTATTLYWSTSGCANLYLSGGMFNNTPVTGTSIGTGILNATTQYTLTGSGPNTSIQYVTVNVTNNQNYCSVSISASQTTVISGGYATITWSSNNCSTVNVSGNGLNSSYLTGSQSIGPLYGSYVYSITGTGSNTATQSVMVSVGQNNNQTSLSVITYAATNIGNTTATLNGYINTGTSGYYSNATEYFQYGTDQNSLINQTSSQYISSNTTMYAYVTGLAPNTMYYFRAVGYGSYGTVYGNTLSFMTSGQGNYGSVTAITSLPTNINTYSARVNGLVTGVSNQSAVQVYFEYGTSNALGMQTSVLSVNGTSANNNYYDTIATTPNTTYYYRIVALVGGQTYYGSTTSFSSLPFTNDSGLTDTTTTTTNNSTIVYQVGSGSGSDLVTLTITDNSDSVRAGDTVTYIVNYQNISSLTLSNVVLSVILPSGITFRQSSAGVYGANNTVTDAIGTLTAKQQGVVSVTGVIDQNISPTNTFMATATMVYTKPSKVQGSAIAYDVDTIGGNNLFGAAAFFGWGGVWYWWYWILFLLILIILILIARYYYHHGNVAKRDSQVPASTHTYYAAPTQNHQYDSHSDDHLPH